ncbi:MAG: DUF4386 domain-containing protein [Solirubrobacteraceae bacterium]
MLAIVLPTVVAGEAAYSSDRHLLDFYARQHTAVHLSAFLTLASSVPMAVFSAIASDRIRAAGFEVPGRLIALVGGTIAAAMLATSGLVALALTQPHAADRLDLVRALYGVSFATAGPGFVVFSGLLLAGISIPVMIGRLAPAWIAWLGLALAAACELASLSALTGTLDPLLAVGRFGAMIWMLAIAFTLRRGPRRAQS